MFEEREKRMSMLNESWIDKIFKEGDKRGVPRLLCSGIFIFIPALILYIPFIVFRIDTIKGFTPRMWIGLICGLIWIWCGPYFIQKWHSIIDYTFNELSESNTIFISKDINYLCTTGNLVFKLTHVKLILMGAILIFSILDKSYLSRYGMHGIKDIYFWIFIVVILYILYFISIGIEGVLFTIKLVKSCAIRNNLTMSLVLLDNSNILSDIKTAIYRTTQFFFSGTFFIPILLDYILYSKITLVKLFLYLITIAFSFTVFLSFYVPTRSIYKCILKQKKKQLYNINTQYNNLLKNILSPSRNYGTLKQNMVAINLYLYAHALENNSSLSIYQNTLYSIFTSIIIPLIAFLFNGEDITQSIVKLLEYLN